MSVRRILVVLWVLFSATFAAATACPTGYSNSFPITILPQTYMSADVSNYVMIWQGGPLFAATGSGGHSLLSTGIDITFCDSTSTNRLDYHLRANTYSTSTGTGIWEIKIPTLPHSGTQTINVRVGNASATDQSNWGTCGAGVWSAFLVVIPFGTSSTLDVTEETGCGAGVNHSSTAVAGILSGGANFVGGGSQWFDTGATQTGLTDFTLEGWLNPTGLSTQFPISSRNAGTSGGIFMCLGCTTGTAAVGYVGGGAGTFAFRSVAIPISSFTHVAGTHTAGSNNQVALYINGTSQTGTLSTSGTNNNPGNSSTTLQVGRDGAASSPFYYSGVVDEVRLAGAVLSADWIAADYRNQSGLSSLYLINDTPIATLPVNPVLNAASMSPYSPSVSSCYLTTNSSVVTTGDPIIMTFTVQRGTITSIADTCGTSFGSPVDTVHFNDGSFDYYTEDWVGAAACTGSDTITITSTSVFGATGQCVELDKNIYSTTVDAHSGGQFPGGGLTQINVGSGLSTENEDFFYSYVVAINSPTTIFPLAGHWLGDNDGQASEGSYIIQPNAGAAVAQTYNLGVAASGLSQYVGLSLKPAALGIVTSTMPTGSLSSAYYYALPVVGGIGQLTWSITSGSLFSGLSLNTGTGEISGTPTGGGTRSITFQVTDGTNTATKTISFTVNASQNTPARIDGCATGTGFTCTLSAVAIGDIIPVMQFIGYHGGYLNLNPPTDSLGNKYQFIDACINANADNNGTSQGIAYYITTSTSAGADTVTPTPNNTPSHAYAAVDQFRNVQAFFDESVCTTGKSASSATITSGNLVTQVPNSMAYAEANFTQGGTTAGAVAPFTAAVNDTGGGIRTNFSEYDVEAAAGTYTPQMTQISNTNGGWNMGALALRPTTTGTATSGVLRHKGEVF